MSVLCTGPKIAMCIEDIKLSAKGKKWSRTVLGECSCDRILIFTIFFVQPEYPQSKTVEFLYVVRGSKNSAWRLCWMTALNQTLGAGVFPIRQNSPLASSFCYKENRCPCLDRRAGDYESLWRMRRQCNRCYADGENLLAPDGFPRESDKPFSVLVGSPSI